MEISTEFSTSARTFYEFRAILRFLIVENRVEIALYANPPPLHGMERANPKRCKLEPERERDRHPLEARAQVPDKREREREREAHKATMSSVAKFLV